MKNSTKQLFFAFLLSLLGGLSANGQAITITAADMPVPTELYNYDNILTVATAPAIGANAEWDYGSYFGNSPDFALYSQETIPFFTDAGVDVYRTMFKNMNAGFGYEIYQEFDFHAEGVDDIGMDIVAQSNTLQPFTGNINDSIFIPSQRYIYSSPRRLTDFPFTANSAWSTNSRRTVDMIINVPAFGLNNAQLTHAFTWVRHDTIVGWGKMKVYTTEGPSIEYDVLMDKSAEYTVDSFYLFGTPAPTALLTAFGVEQGQKTEENYRYTFYRKGTWAYLLGYFFGDDETFTNPADVFVHTDNIETQGPSAVAEHITYSTVLYPNPSKGSEINIMVMGNTFEPGSYTITDAMGKVVQTGQPTAQGNGQIRVAMNSALPAGNYYISLKDKALRQILTEMFEVVN